VEFAEQKIIIPSLHNFHDLDIWAHCDWTKDCQPIMLAEFEDIPSICCRTFQGL
jgi:hypothetical protein